jgi:uncharacterized protein
MSSSAGPCGNDILENSPRLGLDDAITFRCDPSRACFNSCCRDVSILLTPYDVLRMKRALGLDSSEFLERYALVMQSEEKEIPVVFLKMKEEDSLCPFVGESGCRVYGHRPWACRMYPLGMAEPQMPEASARRFYFVLREELCQGHSGEARRIRDWIAEQGVEPYEAIQGAFQQLMYHPGWKQAETLTPSKLAMYFMACYDLDKFRRFIFETRFLEMFDVDETRLEAMRTEDEALLEFAFDWLAFTLFHEKTMRLTKSAELRADAAGTAGGSAEASAV